MFTGIITDLGRVRSVEGSGAKRLQIETAYNTADIAIGASVSCLGACLTVVEKGDGWLGFDVSQETGRCSTLGQLKIGDPVNLECAIRVGEELGGHMVTGHVDVVVSIQSIEEEQGSLKYNVAIPTGRLARLIAAKGSVTLDGVSLTVNDVSAEIFSVNIVPHTVRLTTFGERKAGDEINLEIDILARYLDRMTIGISE